MAIGLGVPKAGETQRERPHGPKILSMHYVMQWLVQRASCAIYWCLAAAGQLHQPNNC